MPQIRFTIRTLMIVTAIVGAALGLVAYRERLGSFDESGGGVDGWIVAFVDLGLFVVWPACVVLVLGISLLIWLLGKIEQAILACFPPVDVTSHQEIPTHQASRSLQSEANPESNLPGSPRPAESNP